MAVLIHRLKFGGKVALARALGDALAWHLEAQGLGADVVVPMPLHHTRLRERGFNQALELARPVVDRLGASLVAGGARRVRPTLSQASLISRRARQRNLDNAFRAEPRYFNNLDVAIVDDVLTSGASAAALTRALRDAGARSVAVWALARAL